MSEGRDGGIGPWFVYMAIDDGATLIAAPEDTPFLAHDLAVVGVRRIPHVIGRGETREAAEADARRQLGRR